MEKTIIEAEAKLITALWKGTECMVKVRELSDVQIHAIGNLSLIQLDKMNVAADDRRWAEFSAMHHKIVKAALVSPTYDEIFGMIGKSDLARDAEAVFIDINKELRTMKEGPEKKLMEQRAASLKSLFDLLMPDDFLITVAYYALGKNRSEIDNVTEEILWECALLQSKMGGRISDYCRGMFTDFNKRDIDNAGLYVYNKRMEQMTKGRHGR